MQSKAKVGQQMIFSLIICAIFYNVGFNNDKGVGQLDDKIDSDAPLIRQK